MDIKKTLLLEHSRQNADKIAQYVGNSSLRFKQLVNIYLTGPYRITQRAAWPLSVCIENRPHLLQPHLKVVLRHLSQPEVHDAVKRNTIRMLQFVEIPLRYQGQVIHLCFRYLQGRKEPVAVKVFSMTVLSRLVLHQPELKQELKTTIEDQMPYAKPAFISRGTRILKQLMKSVV